MDNAEEIFLEVDEYTRSSIQSGESFDALVLFPTTERNWVILYSSVVLYYLCKIRADPKNAQIYAENSEARLLFAAGHGMVALDLPSPVPKQEWSARICLMLCSIMVELGDMDRCYDYLSRAVESLETHVEAGEKDRKPLEECIADKVQDLCQAVDGLPLNEQRNTRCEMLAKRCGDFVARFYGDELSSPAKDVVWQPFGF